MALDIDPVRLELGLSLSLSIPKVGLGLKNF